MDDEPFIEKPQGFNWIKLYYDCVFKPFDVTHKIAKLLWEIHAEQLRQKRHPLDYWLDAQRLIQETAYYIWEEIGQQYEIALDFWWVVAEKYMGSLTALADKILNTGFTDQEMLQHFMEVLPPKIYSRKVDDLARAMSTYASQQMQDINMMSASYFWSAAEYHIITAIAGVGATAKTLQDAIISLAEVTNFSADGYLKFIQKSAYYKWKEAGEPYTDPIHYWLESEKEIFSWLQQGERITNLADKSSLENRNIVDGKILELKSAGDDFQESSPENENEGVK